MKRLLSALLLSGTFISSGITAEKFGESNSPHISSTEKVTEQTRWNVEGDFNNVVVYDTGNSIRSIKFLPFDHDFITDINLYGVDDLKYYVNVRIRSDFPSFDLNELPQHIFSQELRQKATPLLKLRRQDFKGCGIIRPHVFISSSFISGDNNKISEFLFYFYKENIIDDSIIDLIKDNLTSVGIPFDDFWKNGEKCINFINEEMDKLENPTIDDFRKFANEYLNKITHTVHRQECIWELLKGLKDQPQFDRKLSIELLEQITDSSLPFYNEAKRELAGLYATDEATEVFSNERTKLHILALFPTLDDPESQGTINNLVKSMYFNNKLSLHAVPPELQNINKSSEKIVGLLDFICKQERISEKKDRELEEKDKEIAELKRQLEKKD